MLIIGLTGSMGMGKTTAAGHFSARNIPVFSADDAVHDLYRTDLAPIIEAAFPGVLENGAVNRVLLLQALGGKTKNLQKLEALVHPKVRRREWLFLRKAHAAGANMAVLEIPLLFETDADQMMDKTIVLSAPKEVQQARVLARPGMTKEKFGQLLARQMPDAEKRKRAHHVVDTSGPIEQTKAQIWAIINQLQSQTDDHAYKRWAAQYSRS